MKKVYLQPETDSSWFQSDKDWMQNIPGGIATTSTPVGDGLDAPVRKLYV